jgi:hypothetical protein
MSYPSLRYWYKLEFEYEKWAKSHRFFFSSLRFVTTQGWRIEVLHGLGIFMTSKEPAIFVCLHEDGKLTSGNKHYLDILLAFLVLRGVERGTKLAYAKMSHIPSAL